VFTRKAEEALGDITTTRDDTGAIDKSETKVDYGKGPWQFDLDENEDAKFLESHHPSSEFCQFSNVMIAVALKALDIPFSFYDESFTTYSGSRQALLLYEQSAQTKQEDNRELLNALTAWWIKLWVLDGVLQLPAGWTIDAVTWEWIHKGIPWIDPLKEVKADAEAINAALTSRQRVLKRQGLDFWEVADELQAEAERLRDLPSIAVSEPTAEEIIEGVRDGND